MNKVDPKPGQGVRTLKVRDILPDCEIAIGKPIYDLAEQARGKKVVDIGCGYGRNRPIVENAGGEWIGVEPFEGGAHTVVADAEDLPFEDDSFDIAIMDAVLEHVPDPIQAIREVARVLKPGGLFIGYVAFMECYHEISYCHMSFSAMEEYAKRSGMKLEKISGGGAFGIDYHLAVILYPLPSRLLRRLIASMIRGTFWLKSKLSYFFLRFGRKMKHQEAAALARDYFNLECLRQSNGFTYLIRKKSAQ